MPRYVLRISQLKLHLAVLLFSFHQAHGRTTSYLYSSCRGAETLSKEGQLACANTRYLTDPIKENHKINGEGISVRAKQGRERGGERATHSLSQSHIVGAGSLLPTKSCHRSCISSVA